jgi:hypothetical protein
MPTYSLDLSDFIETSFSLFGIKTSLDDYRLAYFLNKHLKTRFEKTENNLEFELNNEKQSYSLFNYEDVYNYNDWFLISNKFIQTRTNNLTVNLFTTTNYNFNSINYLIPERKSFDFFLKITGGVKNTLSKELIQNIKSIQLIDAVFEVKPDELKSKEFLIF